MNAREKAPLIFPVFFYDWTYAVDEELRETIRSFNLPRCSVFDSGFLKLKKLGEKPYLYVFDVLAYDGKYVYKKHKDRSEFLNSLFETKDRFLRPIQVENWMEEFECLMKGDSKLAREIAQSYNIEYDLLKPLIEGFVIKDANGIHSFPQSVKKSSNFYKIRLEDVSKEYFK